MALTKILLCPGLVSNYSSLLFNYLTNLLSNRRIWYLHQIQFIIHQNLGAWWTGSTSRQKHGSILSVTRLGPPVTMEHHTRNGHHLACASD